MKTLLATIAAFAFTASIGFCQTAPGGGTGTTVGSTGGGSRGSASGSSAGGGNANVADAGIASGSLLGGFNQSGSGSRSGAGSSVSSSNFLSQYYANPYAAGIANNSAGAAFGTPVYGNISGGSGGSFSGGTGGSNRSSFGATGGSGGSGFGGSRTSSSGLSMGGLGTSSSPSGGFTSLGNTGAGTAGGFNRGTTGLGTAGVSGSGGISQTFAPAAPSGLKSGMLYTTTVRFPMTIQPMTQVRDSLQSVVARSSSVSAPANVKVDVDSGVVVLRGQVADDDERRHVENLVRLSPGVREVRNELEVKQ
ncbi:MAG: BON domain-containing protein [Gemmataceae bacterium]